AAALLMEYSRHSGRRRPAYCNVRSILPVCRDRRRETRRYIRRVLRRSQRYRHADRRAENFSGLYFDQQLFFRRAAWVGFVWHVRRTVEFRLVLRVWTLFPDQSFPVS